MTVPVFRRVQSRAVRAASSTLQEAARRTRRRMEDRQQQLVAAAEAMRTWIFAQRAMWAEGYPQSLNRAQPEFAGAGVAAAIAMPAAVVSDIDTAPAETWPEADGGRSWSEGI